MPALLRTGGLGRQNAEALRGHYHDLLDYLGKEEVMANIRGPIVALLPVSERAAFMADSQVPWGLDALAGAVSEPAWRSKPSWYLVASDDRMIPPAAQRLMAERAGSTVVEVAGSHAVYVSQPEEVAALIEKAAGEVRAGAAGGLTP